MGPGLLLASLFCVCFLLHEVGSLSLTENPKKQKAKHMLRINEVNADNPGIDTLEYVELYHTSGQQTPLDGYSLVFYNGKGNMAYKVQDLGGFSTNNEGFFLLGSSTVIPKPSVILPNNTIQNGPDAIALYFGTKKLHEGMTVTNEGLVDALVHKSKMSDRADELVRVLTPGVEPFLEDPFFRTTDEALERCWGTDSHWFFQVGAPTPAMDNHCIPFSQLNESAVLINEVNIVSSPGEFEFVELQGRPSSQVDGLVLVLIEGSTQEIYFVMEVHGKTSPDGLLLLGPGQFNSSVDLPFPQNSRRPLLRAGANAVALYRGTPASFAEGAAVSATDLLDALVYSTAESADLKLQDVLTPGKPLFHARERSQQNDTSVNRCVCCSVARDPSIYALGKPTPGQFNDCPKRRFGQTISFCLQVADCQEESLEKNMLQMFLSQALDKRCNCGVSPAYFKDPAVACQGPQLVFTAFLTARSTEQLSSLLKAFSLLIESKEVLHFGKWNGTAVKACLRDTNMTDGPPGTPVVVPERTTKATPLTELLINEVNSDNPGGREDTEYIELFYPGQAPFALQGYWLVLYNGKNNLAYKVINLSSYRTDERGYFLVGSTGVTPKPQIVLPDNTIQNGLDAVALYRSNPNATYKTNMPLTNVGLVDALVYKARGSDNADKLLAVLAPGQRVLLEDDSHSSQDESLSRCYSLRPRDHNSFQVTEMTPSQENTCPPPGSNSTEELPQNHSVVINELGMANHTILYRFIELKGHPGVSLKGYTLMFFSGHNAKPYSTIDLQGTFGSNGLFLILPEGQSKTIKPHEQRVMPSVWSNPSLQEVTHSVALSRHALNGTMEEHLKDVAVYTWETGASQAHPRLSEPIHFVSREGGRPLSLSRCPSCGKIYAVSDPTPASENHCPQESLFLNLEICLLTPNCSMWPQNPQMLASLQQALVRSMEESCFCGICQCYLHGVTFTCLNSTLKVSGQVWARSPEQRQRLVQWHSHFSSSPHPFAVDGKPLKANAACASLGKTAQRSEASFQAWEIALIVVGSIFLVLLLAGTAFYCIKRRPQNYTTIELNDRCEFMADF
ncbi:LTD domain-containing protein [Podarcis lilfordi]|uniref:LTD domain-containing protein n=1 Tax=Podarcis lilfordi TaxID=74358 RepID=A0AA35L9E4_9SAUR|nr:LTD domain-containing protein [Podarcis lilfordi]